jgi:long-chain acyl-CoA synthetase
MVANLAQLLRRSARVHPGRAALAHGGRPVSSYADLARDVEALAGALRGRLGLVPNDRVAMVMKNTPAYVEVLFACWHAGLAAVPINAKLHPREIAYIVENSGAAAVFVTAGLGEGLGGNVVDVGGAEYRALKSAATAPMAEPAEADVAWLFYTSGTTGRPKGVMLTHRNLLAMTLAYFADVDEVRPGDTILHAAPMSHGSGLYIVPQVTHAALHLVPESGGFDPAEIFELLPRSRGVAMFAAPTMVKRLVEHPGDVDTTNLKTIIYGGGPMYVADCKRAMARFGFKLAQIYGQGETPMTITAMDKALHADVDHPRYEARLASVGVAQTGIEIRIADAFDRPLPIGAPGEILVRGDTVMRGYWQNPEASAETLRNGWLHTGDVGSLDEEGFLTLRDRSKDVVISGGSNIYPREVEEVLLEHPAVLEASVVGQPDREWGETVVAFVVVKPGATVGADELDRLCLDRLARFKRPRQVRFVDALPKNGAGKILKSELRELLARKT